jgi:hypothetical protein
MQTAPISSEDRRLLFSTATALSEHQFNELLFTLNPPKGLVPGRAAPQSNRVMALLEWVESSGGPGIHTFERMMDTMIVTDGGTVPSYSAFAISGCIGNITPSELQAIVQLLRQRTGDSSIEIAFFGEGSIQLVLKGSSPALQALQTWFESGELATVLDHIPVESVSSLGDYSHEVRKSRLIEALRLSGKPIMQVGQALHQTVDRANTRMADQPLDQSHDLTQDLDLAHTLVVCHPYFEG